jgi:hypothetical protein
LRIRGYDESFSDYGLEDVDICYRLSLEGLEPLFIDSKYLMSIHHEDLERMKNSSFFERLNQVFYQHVNNYTTRIIFFKNDSCYELIELIQKFKYPGTEQIELIQINTGTFKKDKNKYHLKYKNNNNILSLDVNYKNKKLYLSNGDNAFLQLSDLKLISYIVKLYTFLKNKRKNEINLAERYSKKSVKINECGFGNTILFKNFNQKSFIV